MTGFLSRSWHIESHGVFAASCIGVGFLVVSLELLRKIGKEYDNAILRQFHRYAATRAADLKTHNTSDLCPSKAHFVTFRATPAQQLIRALIRAITFGVAYIVMLLGMYYNGYLVISIIGAELGKFLCDWMVQKVRMEELIENSRGHTVEDSTVCCG